MITIEEFLAKQKKFDSKHSGNYNWDELICDDNIHILEHVLIALVGEIGEVANIVKKISRGDSRLSDVRHELSEEVTDVFIYILKLIYQLNINIEEMYEYKQNKNNARFSRFNRRNLDGERD